ncbi:MAG: glycosyltransferase [Candidatus Omnitrophica bacterium]|nr:glycosyltransferase [Candidatus Omnitrophota bacterium]
MIEQAPALSEPSWIESLRLKYRKARVDFWNKRAGAVSTQWAGYYHRKLEATYQFLIDPGQSILEIGCSQGNLLAALKPSRGVGVDFSSEMIKAGRTKHPELCFIEADGHDLNLNEKFDFIILSDLANDIWDVQKILQQVARHSSSRTRIIFNFYSHLWELPLTMVSKLGLAQPTLYQNWLTEGDISNLLCLENFEIVRSWQEILWPFFTPFLTTFFNRFLVRLWPFNHLALCNFVIARLKVKRTESAEKPRVSVIIPARNEAGNIDQIFTRTPQMGRETEFIFIEGHSQDKTFSAIEEAIKNHPDRPAKLFKQTGMGKGDAVRKGFAEASGDIFMILDADLTVPPEDMSRFYDLLASGKAEFINGVRLVYPMEKQAMRFLNLLANKAFGLTFSWLLGQTLKDTLCGTKALYREDYERIAAHRSYFGDFDPFGDFDLLFGAAKQNLKIVDLPIRYCQRTYGTTNIQRWKHGVLLLRMVLFAAARLKFV